MKMVNIIVAIITLFLFSGCFKHRTANLDGISFEYTGIGFFVKQDTPEQLANARATTDLSSATTAVLYAEAERIKSGQTGTSSLVDKVGVIANDDARESIEVPHPELSTIIKIGPRSFAVIITKNIPDYVNIHNSSGDYTRARPTRKSGIYNGVSYSWSLRVNKARS